MNPSDSFLYRLSEISNEVICIYNSDHKLIDCNPACMQTLIDKSLYKEGLLGRELDYYMPELTDGSLMDHIVADCDPDHPFLLPEYQAKAPVHDHSVYLDTKITSFDDHVICLYQNVTERRNLREKISRTKNLVDEIQSDNKKMQLAMDLLMDGLETRIIGAKKDAARDISAKIFPLIDLLKSSSLSDLQVEVIMDIEDSLRNIVLSDAEQDALKMAGLTPRELQICHLVARGKTSKEIASLLCVTVKTVDFHRLNIRKKLNLTKTTTSLNEILAPQKLSEE